MISRLPYLLRRRSAATVAAVLWMLARAGPVRAAGAIEPGVSDMSIKAAFLLNFAKFTEWPRLAPNAPLLICIVGDTAMRSTVADVVNGQASDGHPIHAGGPAANHSLRGRHQPFLSPSSVAPTARPL